MIRIAIADDHQQVRETWGFILSTSHAFNLVAQCSNGQEAVEVANTHAPDIFLMDINMDVMTGIEATEIITQRYPAVRIVGMSIHVEPIYVRRMLQAGASAYVTKNSSYEEVFEAIKRVYAGEQYICTEVRKAMPELMDH
jgi:two-component system invasion response regulator UvrY